MLWGEWYAEGFENCVYGARVAFVSVCVRVCLRWSQSHVAGAAVFFPLTVSVSALVNVMMLLYIRMYSIRLVTAEKYARAAAPHLQETLRTDNPPYKALTACEVKSFPSACSHPSNSQTRQGDTYPKTLQNGT